ncbi:hypothetical protein OC835_005689 [Tilletia horrida]|nr:hypothetical protein OC835_005689 [Tilletia horrida]
MPPPVLHGELIFKIVSQAIIPEHPDQETYTTYGRRIRELRLVSKAFNMATQLNLRQHSHPFRTDDGPLVRARLIPWLPDPRDISVNHRDWWDRVARQPLEEINNIERANAAAALTDFKVVRTLSLDLRISRVHADNNARLWAKTQVPQWVTASAILTRLCDTARSLEELHLRIPPQQEMVTMVEDIIAKNSNLRSVIIEVDSVNQPYSVFRPVLDLTRVCQEDTPYHKFRRFIIRAPTTKCVIKDSTPFFYRLGDVEEFAISVAELDTPLRNWQWTRKAMQHMPKVQRFDVSVFMRNRDSKDYVLQHDRIDLPNLTDLVLELKDVDSTFLVNVTANKLFNVRINSAVDIDDWATLARNQFPTLFSVNVRCPGSSAMRMDVLGIPRSKYSQNLTDFHNYSVSHSHDFLAYIQPYGRTRTLSSALDASSAHIRTAASTTVPTTFAPSTTVHEPADLGDTDSDNDSLTSLNSDTASSSDEDGNDGEHTEGTSGGDDNVPVDGGVGIQPDDGVGTLTGGGGSDGGGIQALGGVGTLTGRGGSADDDDNEGEHTEGTSGGGASTLTGGGEGGIQPDDGVGTLTGGGVRGGDDIDIGGSDHTHTGCVDCTHTRDSEDIHTNDGDSTAAGSIENTHTRGDTRDSNSGHINGNSAFNTGGNAGSGGTQHHTAIYPPERLRNLHDLVALATQAHMVTIPDHRNSTAGSASNIRPRAQDDNLNNPQLPASKRFRSM